MNTLMLLIVLAIAFIAVAMYYAIKFPNGKWFPSGRDKLLRKLGPLSQGNLRHLKVRSLTRAGGVLRVLMNAEYQYEVKGQPYTITLPLESGKLRTAAIQDAVTSTEFEREVPDRLTLDDGTLLEGRETIRQFFFEQLRQQRPTVDVLFDKGSPALSTVRDWH